MILIEYLRPLIPPKNMDENKTVFLDTKALGRDLPGKNKKSPQDTRALLSDYNFVLFQI
jgi:hypothetical protein